MATEPLAEQLTPREREVLELLRLGLTNREIAERLNMSVDGAKYHVSEIIGKLGVRSRYEAALWPERRSLWLQGLAPAALLWGRVARWLGSRAGGLAALAAGALVVALLVVLSTIGVLMATRAENEGPPAALGTATPCDLEAVTGGPEYGAMQLLNDATGWVLVDQRLKWTDDGGESWRDITPPDLELSDAQFNAGELADFLNRSTGWVFASRPRGPDAPSDLSVWRTTSGGVTWQKASLDGPSGDGSGGPPIFYPLALQFVDAQHGWFALSYAGGTMGGTSFYATKDGGASWSQVGGPHGFTGASGPVHFAGANDSWQAWESPEANTYVTHDGGQNWQATSFSQPAGLGDAWAWNGPFSSGDLGAGNGVIPADHYGGDGPEDAKTGIYVTHDAGRTWTFANPTPAQGGVMYFVSPEIWVQATEEHVFVTQNGGVDWEAADATWPEAQADMCSREPLRLAFADADHGWALVRTNQVGASGTAVELALLATEDGGHTWRILSP